MALFGLIVTPMEATTKEGTARFGSGEKTVRETRRETRRQYSAEENIRIVVKVRCIQDSAR